MNHITTIQFHHLYASQKRVELVCGFYGKNHPKCKEAIQKDTEIYNSFMDQFKKKTDDKVNGEQDR